MKTLLLITGSGPMLVLTSLARVDDEVFIGKLRNKGIAKFMVYELPAEQIEARYGGHFQAVVQDLHETDDLRVLDVDGHRIFDLIRLDALGTPFIYEPAAKTQEVYLD